jgi:IS5 family transposase
VGTAAHVNEVTQAHHLLHGKQTDVFGDAGCQGADKREEHQGKPLSWHIAMRPGQRKVLLETPWGVAMERLEQVKARIRAKGEHAFHVIKNLFHHRKTRYSRAGEEHQAALHPVWPGQPGAGASVVVGTSRAKCVLNPAKSDP